ncbi:hypothetical protein [Halomonas mongoliensis]
MDIKLHKQATTTPKPRAEIQAAPSSITDSNVDEEDPYPLLPGLQE